MRLRAQCQSPGGDLSRSRAGDGAYVVTLDMTCRTRRVIAEMLAVARAEKRRRRLAYAATDPATRDSSASRRARSIGPWTPWRARPPRDAGDPSPDVARPSGGQCPAGVWPSSPGCHTRPLGFPSASVTYRREERAAGSSVSVHQMLRLSIDSMTAFSLARCASPPSSVSSAEPPRSLVDLRRICPRPRPRRRRLDLHRRRGLQCRRGAPARARHPGRVRRPAVCCGPGPPSYYVAYDSATGSANPAATRQP